MEPAHPDRPMAVWAMGQVGAGLSLGALGLEARYQASLGARAEPDHTLALSVGLRSER